MTGEIPLGGGWSVEGVVRVGDTVRRPPIFATPLMRAVLVHLEEIGFDAAPRWLGLDDQGRDVLSFIEGDTFGDCRAIVWSDEQLAASARLLRRYHDALAGSPLAGDQEVVCHGDFGPWNLIWRDGLPVCVIDFDTTRPGPRVNDVGYALWKHLNLGLVELATDEQARRARIFVGAYGTEFGIAAAIGLAQEQAEVRFTALLGRCACRVGLRAGMVRGELRGVRGPWVLRVVVVERRHFAVAARAFAESQLDPDRLQCDLEQPNERGHTRARRGHGQQLLLRLDREVDARRQLEVEDR